MSNQGRFLQHSTTHTPPFPLSTVTASAACLLTAAATGPWSRAATAFQPLYARLWPARAVLGVLAAILLAAQPLRLPLAAAAMPAGSWLATGGLCRLHLFAVAALAWPLLLASAGALLASPLPTGWVCGGGRREKRKTVPVAVAAAAPASPPATPLAEPPPARRWWGARQATAAPAAAEVEKRPPPRHNPPAALTLTLPTAATPWAVLGWAALCAAPLAATAAALAWVRLDERGDGFGGGGSPPWARAAFSVCEARPRPAGLRVGGVDTGYAAAGLLPDGSVDPAGAAPCGCVWPGGLLGVLALTTVCGSAWVALAARALARSALNRGLAGRLRAVAGFAPATGAALTLATAATRAALPSAGWPAAAADLVLAVVTAAAAAAIVIPLVVAPAAAARNARLDADARQAVRAARAARAASVARAAVTAPAGQPASLLAGTVNENAEADARAAVEAEAAVAAQAAADAEADAACAKVEAALAADAKGDAQVQRAGWWRALFSRGRRSRAVEDAEAAAADEGEDDAAAVASVVGTVPPASSRAGGGGGASVVVQAPKAGVPVVAAAGGARAWATSSSEAGGGSGAGE